MTLPGKAQVQAVGRPQFAAALAAQGRAVEIHRAGVHTTLTALALPLTPDGKGSGKVADPQYALLPWKFFFRHDADAVRAPGFTLSLGGRVMTPTGPTVDVADQGVVLMVVAAPLAERTRTETLTFPTLGTVARDNQGAVIKDPVSKNPVMVPGTPVTVPVRLGATTDPRVLEMVGADRADVVLLGRWGSVTQPQLRPDGVAWGSQSPLSVQGQAGLLTLKLAYPDSDLGVEQTLGARFVAIWRAK